nr:SWIM zinc finger family protein [Planctomycetota bacterium]
MVPSPFLTADQVLALAPDATSIKAGRELATARRWSETGADDDVLWGLCQGSGETPYQVRIERNEPAFACSCPSRKFPCKHALGLLLLAATEANAIGAAERPAWVNEWLEARAARAAKSRERRESGTGVVDVEARDRRVVADHQHELVVAQTLRRH